MSDARPPVRDGVSASSVHIVRDWRGSVLGFLCARFPGVDEAVWRARFARGLVLDRHLQPLAMEAQGKVGDRIYYYRELAEEEPIPFREDILYQDENILVADKPHFLPVIPSGRFVQETLLVRLKQRTGIETLAPAHRIDKDTAGLVMFTVNPEVREAYQGLFRRQALRKTYEAVAPFLPDQAWPLNCLNRIEEDAQFFRSRQIEGTANCETRIDLVSQDGRYALYRLHPVTGRKHQLRVTLAALGAPILNDPLYPEVASVRANAYEAPLQLLARTLHFVDPITGNERHFVSRMQLQWPILDTY